MAFLRFELPVHDCADIVEAFRFRQRSERVQARFILIVEPSQIRAVHDPERRADQNEYDKENDVCESRLGHVAHRADAILLRAERPSAGAFTRKFAATDTSPRSSP